MPILFGSISFALILMALLVFEFTTYFEDLPDRTIHILTIATFALLALLLVTAIWGSQLSNQLISPSTSSNFSVPQS